MSKSKNISKEPTDKQLLRQNLNRKLMLLYRPYVTKFEGTRFIDLLLSRYNVGETRLMTTEQLEDLVSFMEHELSQEKK